MKDWYDMLMLAVPFATATGIFVQAHHVYHTKRVEGISFTNTFIAWVASMLWLIYGLRKGLPPLIIGSTLSFIGLSISILLVRYYKKHAYGCSCESCAHHPHS